jgi:metal-responsive CopG/Arc/MetJ family transcriptional regulator
VSRSLVGNTNIAYNWYDKEEVQIVATKIKLTVTIDESLVKELDEEAKKRKLSRSALIEEAIKTLKKKQLEELLKKGYQAMAEENLRIAEETIHFSEFADEKR